MPNFPIQNLRDINWGKKHLWDVKFDTAPAPFNNFFPAFEVDIGEAILDTFSMEFYNRTYEVPMMSGQKELRLSVYDDSNLTLFKWIKNWINIDILNLDKQKPYVSRLETIVKLVHILKLSDNRQNIIETKRLWVYPKMSLNWEGSSEAGPQQYPLQFIIAGELPDA